MIHYYQLKKRVTERVQANKSSKTQDWNQIDFPSYRMKGDTMADDTIKHVFSHQGDRQAIINLFHTLTTDDKKLPDDVDANIKSFFDKSAVLPDWADKDMIEYGQQFYLSHGLLIGLLLFYKSLPSCYTGAKGAKVLVNTAMLTDDSHDLEKLSSRLSITGSFIYKTMMPGANQTNGSAISATQKVRLIHAASRYYVIEKNLRSGTPWDSAELGLPINQQDMAGTLMSFSALILEGLEALGDKISDIERECYIHCWNVIGHIFGVDAALIPNNAASANALGHAIISDQQAESVAGKSLAEALMRFCDKITPAYLDKRFHAAMINKLTGSDLSSLLGIEDVNHQKANKYFNYAKRYVWIRTKLEKLLVLKFLLSKADAFLLSKSYTHLGKQNGSQVDFEFNRAARSKV